MSSIKYEDGEYLTWRHKTIQFVVRGGHIVFAKFGTQRLTWRATE